MSGIWAKTILRSRNAAAPDKVLSTLLCRMPRCILAEFNTHRAFSRNSASTRAIPTERLILQVQQGPFIPAYWGRNQKGMQAGGVVDDPIECEAEWLRARDAAVASARYLVDQGLHKQISGRLLEAWMFTIVCVSATEWNNFLALRDHPDAEPHIALLAKAIRAELDRTDNIQMLRPGDWHMPFIGPIDKLDAQSKFAGTREDPWLKGLIPLSVARCASTSYKTVDGFDMTLDRAIALHDKLVGSSPLHASPAEHVAQADEMRFHGDYMMGWKHPHEHGNFTGFRQYRKQLLNEAVPG